MSELPPGHPIRAIDDLDPTEFAVCDNCGKAFFALAGKDSSNSMSLSTDCLFRGDELLIGFDVRRAIWVDLDWCTAECFFQWVEARRSVPTAPEAAP